MQILGKKSFKDFSKDVEKQKIETNSLYIDRPLGTKSCSHSSFL